MGSGWAIGAVDLARRRSYLAGEAGEAVGREAFAVVVFPYWTRIALRFGNRAGGFNVLPFPAVSAGGSAHLLAVLACGAACTVGDVVVEGRVGAVVCEIGSFRAVSA